MANSIPLPLIISWILFFGFLNTHQRHAMHYKVLNAHQRHLIGYKVPSKGYRLALWVSLILGILVGLCLLIYYFIQVSWYWPLVLFLGGSLISGYVFGILDAKIGLRYMGLISFIGWPVSAIWTFFIINSLHS